MSGHNGKTNLRELAYQRFTHNLLIGKLRPGQFISQRELVEITGVSLAAIREAIPRLEAEKLLETIPQRGMQIAAVDLRMMKEVFQLWMVLAKAAAERFNQSASGKMLDELQLTHKDLLLRASRLPDPNLAEDARHLERRFHELLIAALDNALICNIYRVNRIKIDMIRILRGQNEFYDVIYPTKERLRIIEALKRRDVKQVVQAVEEHVEATLHRAAVFLGSGFLSQGPAGGTEEGIIAA
jgi:DNA-binding GntR family transcriptional regulator